MSGLSFVTLDVFTTTKFAGNPLAVVRVPANTDIPTYKLQEIAREFNLSETVFLYDDTTSRNDTLQWRLRIFLTSAEIPFAGHPTIGAACWAFENLANGAAVAQFACNAGKIRASYLHGVASAEIPHNVHEHTQHPFTKEDVLKLQPSLEDYVKDDAIAVVSPVKGMNFIMVELPDIAALANVGTSARIEPRLDDEWNTGFSGSYFYVPKGRKGQLAMYRTRMIEGRFEDPATGSAACALAAYLALKQREQSMDFIFTQGVEMGRQSDIGVKVTLNESLNCVQNITLSGKAVKVMSGTIDL